MELVELEAALSTAKRINRDVQRKVSDAIDAASKVIRDMHELEVALAYDNVVVAKDAVVKELDRLARTRTDTQYPVGTKMVKWEVIGWGTPRRFTRTKSFGVTEVTNLDTVHPESMGSWSRAELGREIVRFLKKDGLPGIKYDKLWKHSRWYPVGVDPNPSKAE